MSLEHSAIYEELENTRKKLKEKRLLEGRPHHVHDLLEGFEQTVIANLLTEARVEGKDAIQALYVFCAAVRYLSQQSTDEFDQEKLSQFTQERYTEIQQLLKEQSLSKNMGQRALPIMSLLAQAGITKPLQAIELGASSGLIGRALMNRETFIDNLDEYCFFSPEFKKTLEPQLELMKNINIQSYIGVDLQTPTAEWNLACVEEEEGRKLLQRFLDFFPAPGPFEKVQQGDALQFLQSEEAVALGSPLLITSMMLYQLPPDIRVSFEENIDRYLTEKNGYHVELDYDEKLNRFTGKLFSYESGKKEEVSLILKDGDAMEWSI